MNTRLRLVPVLALALTLLGASSASAAPAPAPPRPQGPCDVYGGGGHALRRRPQHDACAVRVVQRPALPGEAAVGRQDAGHRCRTARRVTCSGRGRVRRRGRAGRVLRQHALCHQRDLRPVRQGQPPSPGTRGAALPWPGEGRVRHPADCGHGAHHDRRPQGLRRLHHPGHGVPQQRRHGHRDRRRTGGHLLRRRRHALRQRAAASTTATRRPTVVPWAPAPWRPPTSGRPPTGAEVRVRARGSWPTWRRACSRDTTRSRTSAARPSMPGAS